jgi:hypothetical protein
MLRQELFTKPRPYDTKFRRNFAKFRGISRKCSVISRNFAVRNFVDHPTTLTVPSEIHAQYKYILFFYSIMIGRFCIYCTVASYLCSKGFSLLNVLLFTDLFSLMFFKPI